MFFYGDQDFPWGSETVNEERYSWFKLVLVRFMIGVWMRELSCLDYGHIFYRQFAVQSTTKVVKVWIG